ncbi:helix-turn-helix domain-containing protein [bacterium]|nr:helix-turn-helix domain-containing protein [bacterium]MBU1985557.1 helix-turn-helix domain-containing protein [bacterium]
MKSLMNAQQTAEYLGVSLPTIRKWTHLGFIPRIKLGGTVRYDRDVIDAWTTQRSTQGRTRQRTLEHSSN